MIGAIEQAHQLGRYGGEQPLGGIAEERREEHRDAQEALISVEPPLEISHLRGRNGDLRGGAPRQRDRHRGQGGEALHVEVPPVPPPLPPEPDDEDAGAAGAAVGVVVLAVLVLVPVLVAGALPPVLELSFLVLA